MMLTDEIMPNYRRARVAGATYFFTVNLWDRSSDLLVRHVDLLREAMRMTRSRHPFQIDAWVVLPEHMHCLWTLPPGDADFALRWQVLKYHFSRRLPQAEPRTLTCRLRHERGVWQRRYWEHLIRDEEDYRRHVDYIHINPLKHGHVGRVADWPYSTFHRAVREGLYPQDWAGEPDGGQRAALTTLPGDAGERPIGAAERHSRWPTRSR
jgi:putative transposase